MYPTSYNNILLKDSRSKSSQKVFVVHKELIEIFGEKSARLISQIHYLSTKNNFGKVYEGRKWVFNTFEYLADSLCISLSHTKRLVSELSKQGIIHIKKLADYKSNRTNYYAIDYERLNQFIHNMKHDDCIEANTQSEQQQMERWTYQNGTMVNTNKTNKIDINKSETKGREGSIKKREVAHTETDNLESQKVSDQAQQVKNLQNKNDLKNQNKTESLQKQKSTIAQDMLAVWNQVIGKAPAKMSKDLARHLVAAYKAKFSQGGDLKSWKHYCHLIASSDYLMGENFKLSLMWALKFATIERILNFDLGVKERAQHQENMEDFEQQALEHIQSVDESPLCLDVRRKLLKLYGAKTYVAWFKSLTFIELDNQVRFKAPSRFHEDYILQNFSDVLK